MPSRAIEVGSGTTVDSLSLVVSTGVKNSVPLPVVNDHVPPAKVSGADVVWKLKDVAPPKAKFALNVISMVLPPTTVEVPGGAITITFEILPPVPLQVVSRSFTAMPVLFVSETVVMKPAWLGVLNAKLASSPAARLRKREDLRIQSLLEKRVHQSRVWSKQSFVGHPAEKTQISAMMLASR